MAQSDAVTVLISGVKHLRTKSFKLVQFILCVREIRHNVNKLLGWLFLSAYELLYGFIR